MTFDNQTGSEVSVMVDGEFWFTVDPHDSVDTHTLNATWKKPRTVLVFDDDTQLYSDELTKQELEQMGYRVTIPQQ